MLLLPRILEEICGAETVGPVEFKKQNTAAVKNILVQYLTKSTAESSRGVSDNNYYFLNVDLPHEFQNKSLRCTGKM